MKCCNEKMNFLIVNKTNRVAFAKILYRVDERSPSIVHCSYLNV
ncbi:hypothetical protein SAMN05421863_102716 [Nitrosomonas communis]|uniref:Uncharacterized protein n=1 Tax=Nitrosomonas communis TaxID=44574 RepID=A0A1I4QK22_9PROT|nr:hypothetical protein SAMN05421863_102716 [Nitrosomonas communis]